MSFIGRFSLKMFTDLVTLRALLLDDKAERHNPLWKASSLAMNVWQPVSMVGLPKEPQVWLLNFSNWYQEATSGAISSWPFRRKWLVPVIKTKRRNGRNDFTHLKAGDRVWNPKKNGLMLWLWKDHFWFGKLGKTWTDLTNGQLYRANSMCSMKQPAWFNNYRKNYTAWSGSSKLWLTKLALFVWHLSFVSFKRPSLWFNKVRTPKTPSGLQV